MEQFDINSAIAVVAKEQEFVLVSHVNPDGDNIGSMVGLALGLQQLGKKVVIVNHDETPKKLNFLADLFPIITGNLPENLPGVLITLDCTDIGRTGFDAQLLGNFNQIINIDHHISNTLFGNINLVDTQAAATGEIVFNILQQLKVNPTDKIATALHTAIMTDTGCFRFSSTTPRTMEIAAQLLDWGAELDIINTSIFETNTLAATKFLAGALDRIETEADGQIAYLIITQDLMAQYDILEEECDSLVNYAKAIEGIEVAYTVKESLNNIVKISFRSKGRVDVNIVASKYGGGGHQRAAGCKITNCTDIDQLILNINTELKKLL